MKVESIIFDVDGTLWNTAAVQVRAYNAQLRSENIPLQITEDALVPLFGSPMDVLAEGLFGAVVPPPACYGLMDRCIDRLNVELESCTPEEVGYPNLRATLEQLAKDHRLFIVSNGPKGYGQQAAKTLGATDLFRGYLSFGDTGKPKGQTILQLMAEHNITSAAYVGDTQGDLDAAREAGLPLVWAAYGFGQVAAYAEKIRAFAELADIFVEGNR